LASDFYDVVVIGAGPAGSYAAYKLTSQGRKVAVLEQKEAPGMDICCTGIISPECFDSFGITSDVILARANSAKFFSPSGKSLRLATEKVQAYIVNRASFDQAIAARAKAQGANYLFSSRVTGVAINRDGAQIEALCQGSREILKARAVIIASGFKPKLSQRLGLGRIANFAIGAQAEVETQGIDEVEVYLGQQIASGFFAWLVPTSDNKALAGVISPSQAKLYLEKLLTDPLCQSKVISKEPKIRQKAIPLGTLPRTYGDRVLVIGDAAGQVKPTTGGGIYFGHLGAQMAAEVLHQALAWALGPGRYMPS
jgi:geranylgeranyl reductase family protein